MLCDYDICGVQTMSYFFFFFYFFLTVSPCLHPTKLPNNTFAPSYYKTTKVFVFNFVGIFQTDPKKTKKTKCHITCSNNTLSNFQSKKTQTQTHTHTHTHTDTDTFTHLL